ncbi:AraC family transcriptional regulator [Chitinophaga sp. MM2321]|uniref:AraC family transcriptional regulator n=1 Tax=Chitinophaga sp. MM2321 TaxID=3137178 RepID=UPI0032D57B3A
MKPLIQKLPLGEHHSFVARTYRTPHFEVGWHQHIEYELTLVTEGSGLCFVGNHVSKFETGDVYFLGTNLPHTFQKIDPVSIGSSMVIQFCDDFWGAHFMNLPESRQIKQLFETSRYGLKITGESKSRLQPLIRELEFATGFNRILLLGSCLQIMAEKREYLQVSTQETRQLNHKDKECIDKVFRFTIDNFREPVTLTGVAGIACMSIPAFCRYFKKRTQKTYFDFLNEVRVGYACTLLLETRKPVLNICYESGYNTIANFHKQFLKIKKLTPLQYRKYFAEDLINSHPGDIQ